MSDSFSARTGYDGDINEVIKLVLRDDYGLGDIARSDLIEIGMEDYNLHVHTSQGEYLVKIITKVRDDADAKRYVEIMQAVTAAGINHPKLFLDKSGQPIHVHEASKMRFVVLEFIQGHTFYETKKIPSHSELEQILRQAATLHNMTYRPAYSFDSWAIPNLHSLYEKTAKLMDKECIDLVDAAVVLYDKIPLNQLPQCFIHGDIVPTNIIKDPNGKIYIFDFAVAGVYPKIQELAVIAADLLEEGGEPIRERIKMVVDIYLSQGGQLSETEISNMLPYTLAAMAVEIMGGHYEKYVNKGDNVEEIDWWISIGKSGLKEALRQP